MLSILANKIGEVEGSINTDRGKFRAGVDARGKL